LRSNTLFWSFILFSFFAILGPFYGPKLFKGINLAALQQSIEAGQSLLNEIGVFVGIAAAVAIARACDRSEGHGCGTHIGVAHGSAHLLDFIHGEFPRSKAGKYSGVFWSRHWLSPFYFLLHSLARALKNYGQNVSSSEPPFGRCVNVSWHGGPDALTLSTSSAVNSRAPKRWSTRFVSF
jgi:hypothetical protein